MTERICIPPNLRSYIYFEWGKQQGFTVFRSDANGLCVSIHSAQWSASILDVYQGLLSAAKEILYRESRPQAKEYLDLIAKMILDGKRFTDDILSFPNFE